MRSCVFVDVDYLYLCFLFIESSNIICFFFFFQAEDGIRDPLVTGVQTLLFRSRRSGCGRSAGQDRGRRRNRSGAVPARSEERRVGKECWSWWWPDHSKKKEI